MLGSMWDVGETRLISSEFFHAGEGPSRVSFLLTCNLTGTFGFMHIWYRGQTARTGESQPLLAETTTNTRPSIADSPAA